MDAIYLSISKSRATHYQHTFSMQSNSIKCWCKLHFYSYIRNQICHDSLAPTKSNLIKDALNEIMIEMWGICHKTFKTFSLWQRLNFPSSFPVMVSIIITSKRTLSSPSNCSALFQLWKTPFSLPFLSNPRHYSHYKRSHFPSSCFPPTTHIGKNPLSLMFPSHVQHYKLVKEMFILLHW